MNKIKKIINNPYWLLYYFLLATKSSRIVPDKLYLQLQYRCVYNKKLNLNSPKLFSEKIQWLKLYDRKSIYTRLVDKLLVKDIISEQLGKEYVIPTLGIWDKFDDIDFDKLPMQFVLKPSHDSGSIVICTDKSTFDINSAKKKINKSIKNNYYHVGREWPYKNVKPRIFAEKYMLGIGEKDLKDYKVFNFNGKPKIIQVDYDRFTNHKRNFYSEDWDFIDFELLYENDVNIIIDSPVKLGDILRFSEKLSENISFCRIDFYSINNAIYFGEITFYPGGGLEKFTPEEWDFKLGNMIKLPLNKVK